MIGMAVDLGGTGLPRQSRIGRDQEVIPLFQTHCALCHGLGGEGSELLGTPDLTRGQFRNIRAPQDIRQQILRGTDGRGPIRESRARTPAG